MKSPFTREQREKLQTEVFHRLLSVDVRAADTEARTVPASMSSESPVRRWFGNEILMHTAEAVNLGRASEGKLPMLFGHDTDVLIGAAQGFKVDNGRLAGELRFAESTRAPEVWEQIKEGMPLGISIGYRIDEWKESADSDDVTVTRWTLHEVSVVTVPADSTVGIGRSLDTQEATPMADENVTPQASASLANSAAANVRLVHERAKSEGIQAERDRIAQVRELFLLPGFQSDEYLELERNAIDGGLSVEDTRAQILQLAGSGVSPVASIPARQSAALPHIAGPSGHQMPKVQAGRDQREGFYEAATEALALRANLLSGEAAHKARENNEAVGMSLVELARECLRRQNVSTGGMDAMRAVGLAFTTPGSFVRSTITVGTGDFPAILLDAANKSMLSGWTENEETFSSWTRSMSISDFKTQNLVNLSNFGALDVVPEHAEYKYGEFSDVKETITLRTYGKLFNLSRQAIINDDLSAFTAIPMKMGRAAARMVGDEAYGVLTTNAAMAQDSIALFHADHGNFITAGTTPPTVASVNVGFVAMATQTDPSGATLNVSPRFLIVPKALETTARTLAAATYDPAAAAGTLTPNAFAGRLVVVADARLDVVSAGWYLAASPSQVGTVVVGYLNGQTSPYLEQETAFSQDGVRMKVRMDCRAAAEDFRGLFYNDGS